MAAMSDALPPQPPAETILVSGRAITPAAGAEAFGALNIPAEALNPASGRVEEALRALGGLQLFRTSSTRTANPTSEGLTARALSGNAASRIEVTLDGVPLSDPFFGFVSWGALVGQPLAGAQLVRGGGLGGPGALAGTLELTSAMPANAAMLRGGSRDSLEGQGGIATQAAGGALGISGGFSRGDGYKLVEEPGPGDVATRYRQWSLAGTARTQVGALALVARLSGFADQRLRGVEGADIESRGGDASLGATLEGAWRLGLTAHAKLRDFSTVTRTLDSTRTVATTALDQVKTPASGWGVELRAEPPLGEDSALQLGAGYRSAEGRTIERFRFQLGEPTRGRVAGGSQQVASLFLNGSHRATPQLLLTAAGRVDRWRLGAGELSEFDLANGAPTLEEPSDARSGTELSGRLGAVWRPVPAVRLRAAGYRGWRLPTLNELYRPFRAGQDATAANATLNPEHLWGAEASLGWQPLAAVDLSATFFWNRLSDPITNVTLGAGPGNFPGVGFVAAGGRYRQRQNLEAIEAHGVEADARLPLGPFALTASGAWVDAEVKGGGLDGYRPAQAPEFSGSLALGWQRGGWSASAMLRHFGARFEDDQNNRRLPAATTLDLEAAIPLGHMWRVELAAENLTDANVATGFSGSQLERGQPRTLWIGLSWRPAAR
ncbi:TonB-dependent receptor [Sandaracinobacter sp. RS1-74]|uniref:TonB-dependent receptor n=1 Tax=Sandaracinobacteroides sayramensis TaxID=2913411 RepID=UPI001EDA8D50|nr:TonB-dependent receptor [Sandaracinobacteroides sayramensis]MCG2840319.1 TonB-dependent receptor [Sandaracinobacteroides sayramensis]